MLLDAFARIKQEFPAYTLTIYGEGPFREELQNRIKLLDLTDSVDLPGQVQNVFECIADAELFVLSSDFEGMPNALMEAMALGTVCISTNCRTGPKDLIDDKENGFLVPVNNEDALANAILSISQLPLSEQIELGTSAKQKIISLQEGNSLEELEKMIEGFKTK